MNQELRDLERISSRHLLLSGSYSSEFYASSMSLPKPGDTVKVTLLNRETIEGVVEWVDGNGFWIKGAQRSRWVPLEALSAPHDAHEIEGKQERAAE